MLTYPRLSAFRQWGSYLCRQGHCALATPSQRTPDERISSLETAVEGLAHEVRGFVAATGKDISEIRTAIQNSSRAPWGNIISATGLAVIVIGAIGTSYLAPAQVRLEYAEKEVNRMERWSTNQEARVDAVERESSRTSSSLKDKLSEVETQFGWMVDAVNQYRATQDRMLGLMWNKVYGESLPLLHVNPIGPVMNREKQRQGD